MTDVLSPTNGRTAEARLLVVLDVMLPDVDGFVVLRRLRAGRHPMPVLFLTARDANDDKVTGLTLGGDDYVTKPFSLEEVIARIRAVLRRTRALAGDSPARLTVGDFPAPASWPAPSSTASTPSSGPPLARCPIGATPSPRRPAFPAITTSTS